MAVLFQTINRKSIGGNVLVTMTNKQLVLTVDGVSWFIPVRALIIIVALDVTNDMHYRIIVHEP